MRRRMSALKKKEAGPGASPRILMTRLGAASSGSAKVKLLIVKTVHSLIFIVLAAGVIETVRAGIREKTSRFTGPAIGATIVEGAILALNQNHCPLTDLAEQLGSEHGSVSDIFLPRRVADHIPVIFTTLFGFGIGRLLEAEGRKPRP